MRHCCTNTRSMLAGGASSNIFLSVDGRVLTPPIADGALPGTARAALLAEAPSIEERSLGASDIARAEAAAITNALVQIRPVASIDGRELRQDHKLIAALYSALG